VRQSGGFRKTGKPRGPRLGPKGPRDCQTPTSQSYPRIPNRANRSSRQFGRGGRIRSIRPKRGVLHSGSTVLPSTKHLESMLPSPYEVLLRGCRKGIAGRGGNVFRPLLGRQNRGDKTERPGAHRTFSGFQSRLRGATGGRVPGCFGARSERRIHVLKNRNVGNSSAIFSRGGENGFGNGARCSRISRLRAGLHVAHEGVLSRATRRDHGGASGTVGS
jgi:hypothetical protein